MFTNPFETQDDRAQAIADLRSGLSSRFWECIKFVIEANTAMLASEALDDESLTAEATARVKLWRKLNKALAELPETIIADLEGGKSNPVDFDPYPKTYEELIANGE